MMTQQDWKKLHKPIIGLGLALMLVGAVVGVANKYHTENAQAMQAQQNLLNQAEQKYHASGSEKDLITQYLPNYNKLIASGFIGEERRIEWIETLRQTHNQHKLFSIDYNINQQEIYKPNFLGDLGNFVMHRSVMKINLQMLHEGDLFNLLNGLQSQTTPFIVRKCNLDRLSNSAINPSNISANLQADCEIDWLTLREPQQAAQTP